MITFVLVYDRSKPGIVELARFSMEQQSEADAFRLTRQREAIDHQLDREVVMFRAASEEALRRTHGSYFLSGPELVDRTAEALPKPFS